MNPIIRPATTIVTAIRMKKAKKPGLLMDPSFSCSKVELFILAHVQTVIVNLKRALNLYSTVCNATAVVDQLFYTVGRVIQPFRSYNYGKTFTTGTLPCKVWTFSILDLYNNIIIHAYYTPLHSTYTQHSYNYIYKYIYFFYLPLHF